MFRGCLSRLAIPAFLFLILLHKSLAFSAVGLTSSLVRHADSTINSASRFSRADRLVVTNRLFDTVAGPGSYADTRLTPGASLPLKRTCLAGLASKNSVEGGGNSGPLKEKKSNNDQRRGGGLNIIRLGRRNRIQQRQGTNNGADNVNDDDLLPSVYGPEPMIITETQPNRGRWRPLRVLRPRLRNGGDVQNRQEQPMSLSDGSDNKRNRNRNRRGNRRRENDLKQKSRRESFAKKEEHSDSDGTFSADSETSSATMLQSSIADELMSIVPVANSTTTRDSGDKPNNEDKDSIADLLSKRDSDESEEEQTDDESSDKKEKRVSWSATAKSTRILKLDSEGSSLLNKYMTQPVEKYSVITFYGDADGDEDGSESGDSGEISGRRWLIRRLTETESAPYRSRERGVPNFLKRRKAKEVEENGPKRARDSNSANFFRLAVPLMPLIGLDLTPVIDVEVIPPASILASLDENIDDQDIKSSKYDDDKEQDVGDPGENRRAGIMGRFGDDHDVVRIQSLRVSLLSTEEEVSEIMTGTSTGPFRRQRGARNHVTKPSATAVSKNQNVRKMGYEAIHMIDKLAEVTHPHLYFESEITWNEGRSKRNRKNHDCAITVKSTVATSVTIPPLPIAFPLPTGLFVSKIGSTITKRVLKLVLPRFLKLLESDFKRWASIDVNEKSPDQ